MRKKHLVALIYLALSFLFISILYCGSTKSVVKKITPYKYHLKKRVAVLPFTDNTGMEPGVTGNDTAGFVKSLKKSTGLLLYEPFKRASGPVVAEYSGLRIIIQPEFLDKAWDLGMNALVAGVLNPVEGTVKKKGIWPFRRFRRVYTVTVAIDLLDMNSKTLLFTNSESMEVAFSLDNNEDEKGLIAAAVKKALPFILKRQASVVIKRLEGEPWTGKITSVDKNRITITAGKEIGLKKGLKFEVFAQGESIPSEDGRSFSLLGDKVGDIKVTSIANKQSIAEPMAEGLFSAGQIIRLRP